MSIWSRLTQSRTKSASGAGVSSWIAPLGANASATGMLVSQATAMQVTSVMACVAIISEDVAKLAPRLYRRTASGREEVTDHPVARLLRRPNGWQTWFEFCEQMTAALLLRGNAFAVILRGSRGEPAQLVPVNPDRVTMLEAPDGELFYQISRSGLHEMFVLEGVPLAVPAGDVFHLRWLSSNSLVGVSRIALAREAIGLALAQEGHAARLAGNGARPSGVLKIKSKLTEEAARRLKASWEAAHAGIENVARTAVLEDGVDWQALSLNSVDMEFLASRRFQVEEIARMFRMPLNKIGVMEKGSYNSINSQDQDYVNNVLMSYLERWESKFERTFDLDQQGLFIEFDLSRLLRADITSRYEAYRVGKLSGFLSTNEIRAAEGLDPVVGGDTLMQPLNMAPVGSDMSGSPADGGKADPAQPVTL
jgi:HK97 family phage portal protein